MTFLTLLQLILMVAAFILFLLAAIGVSSPRCSLTDLGLACWVGSALLGVAGK